MARGPKRGVFFFAFFMGVALTMTRRRRRAERSHAHTRRKSASLLEPRCETYQPCSLPSFQEDVGRHLKGETQQTCSGSTSQEDFVRPCS